jgi:tRNA(Ile)-lysidine synthase
MPVLRTRFPAVDASFARAATHFGEAAELLDALARIDAGACGERPMSATALRALSPARQANLLRWQLRQMGLSMPDETRLTEALRQLNTCDRDRPLSLALGCGELQVYRDAAWLTPPLPVLPASPVPWLDNASMPWGEGRIEVDESVGEGVALASIEHAECQMRVRWSGCRLALPRRPAKDVRQLGQEAGLPPSVRDRLPILAVNGRAAWMAGVGVATEFACPPGERGLVLRWIRPAAYSASGEAAL